MRSVESEEPQGLRGRIRALVNARKVRWSTHAREKASERGILPDEAYHVLKHGVFDPERDRRDARFDEPSYAYRGKTLDGRELRIVVAVYPDLLLVVTAIDKDK